VHELRQPFFEDEDRRRLSRLVIQSRYMKWNWDYHIPDDWRPTTDGEWEWFLVRKINYGDYEGLDRIILKKYFPKIKKRLDPGKVAMFTYFLHHETNQ